MCVCVCVNAYLNIPHPKLCKACLYKLGRGNKGGRMRKKSDKVLEGGRERESERKKVWGGVQKEERKISLLCSCCYGNPLDNTYSLCHSGMKESDELTPFYSPCKNARSLCENHTGLPPSFVSSWGTTPSRSLSLPLSIHSRKKKRERERQEWPSQLKLRPYEFCLIKIKVCSPQAKSWASLSAVTERYS